MSDSKRNTEYHPWSNDTPPRLNSTIEKAKQDGIRFKPELRVTFTFDKDGNKEVVVLAEGVKQSKPMPKLSDLLKPVSRD